MAFIHEIQIKSLGFPGAPGYTNLYFLANGVGEQDAQFAAAYQFLQELRPVLPNVWSGQIEPNGRLLEETTGALGSFTVAPAASRILTNGLANEGFGSGVSGAVIAWGTGTINRGRLVRGRTFVVPMTRGAYGADGTLEVNTVNNLTAGGVALINAAVGFGVWSRPRLGLGGKFAPALTARVNDRASFLSSRRA